MAGKRRNGKGLPYYDELIIPTLKALIALGGSGSVDEINQKVYEIAGIADNMLAIPHKPEHADGRSEVDYRLSWSRTYLKKYGLIDNSSRGVWSLTKANLNPEDFSSSEIVQKVRELTNDGNLFPGSCPRGNARRGTTHRSDGRRCVVLQAEGAQARGRGSVGREYRHQNGLV